jgi:hypothetical protein
VPGTAALNKFSANALSVSCASARNCAVGGFYEEANQDSEAFVATEAHGVWCPAAPVRGTVGAAGLFATITSVSCASSGNCAAGGSYADRAGHPQAFLVTEKSGVWSAAQQVARALNAGGDASANTWRDLLVAAGYGLRPTPPNWSSSSGTPNGLGSGCHRGTETRPGSTISSPSKNCASCSGLRRVYGTAPLSLYSS